MIWSLSVPCDKSDWRRGWDRGGREEEMEGITISIFGLDRVRREREGREETSGEEGRPMIDIELIRIIVGGGEDCKGLKINKNGGWESETDGAERGDQITRPDRTMRGFGRTDGLRTDFGERTSRLIFMSSSHDLSTPSIPPRVVSKAPAQFLPPHSLRLFCGKDFSVVRRVENLGNPRARKKRSYSRVAPRFFWGKRFFPGQIFGHTRTRVCPIPSFPESFFHNLVKEERLGQRSHAFLSDKAKKKLVMAFPLFRRTFLCCSLGQTVIGEIDIERRPFPS